MDTMLSGFDFTFAYLDDIVISSKTKGDTQRTSKEGFCTNTGIWVEGKGSNMRFLYEQNQISGTYH